MIRTASLDIKAINTKKAREYVDSVDLEKVPRNNRGKCSRQRICKELEITYSTIGTNDDLKKEFERLDERLIEDDREKGAVGKAKPKSSSKEIRQLESRITKLENRMTSLKSENKELRTRIKRYEHFENTGRSIRA